ncbi:2-succinyl-5-enolpyruvyl-6-hydroxy-3-cyclohexene-1-carboxylic-acid synthase [Desulfobacter postgatei]|jgi:2-succinyl-5-enolpyruvyl-6-hydroxy-3-cyclohexene-1-carboxylate synthase|uniref:2-succinyl-5-enolpyruvyl-6-hydroxy-3- cyclohexene-1-carboxylic-acid synthase n=1 Tax=Desulfobacter postgatei TaxID=2293 RepID=UPI002A35F889|nr:2-succinyl-5-enolpyruvyl-6-hydroxy-3-cyclohexene-1-carboxylic-acid synthase [Desulfobacter postgatei]MDX9964094.1 2-succinyl-5-enolpyruvyl-6-hydroxy-3-cyclohexene-1-carboxylic-acid synthase [Desulfobacter postgatei]
MMISTKRHVQQLASLFLSKKIFDIVLCPGSRNGPLIHTLAGCGQFDCRVIVDERSAGYFALGLAQAKENPVVIVCSSGTATINFAPAVAEAFYQNIPLIVVTADRPAYWIDQLENQCIQQTALYRNFIKQSCSLPLEESDCRLWSGARLINEILNTAVSDAPGPVHINIPLEEPLHRTMDAQLPDVKVIGNAQTRINLDEKALAAAAEEIGRADKILVLAGQSQGNGELDSALALFAEKTGAVVAAEHLANLQIPSGCCCAVPELVLGSISSGDAAVFQPDLLITFGRHFVSKRIRQFLRANKPHEHIHVDAGGGHMDTYQALTRVCAMSPELFFGQLADMQIQKASGGYAGAWKDREQETLQIYKHYLDRAPFSDFTACAGALKAVPEDSVLHLGNSSTVRYAVLTPGIKEVTWLGNRGTSGIDGSVSTAVGYASCSSKINTLILGDLSFFYDSNGLWNKYLGKNLRIILLNNGGGNIFSFVEDLAGCTGEDNQGVFQNYFFAGHSAKAQGFASTFGLDYLQAGSASQLDMALEKLYNPGRIVPTLLEVFTDARTNTKVFKGLFSEIKKRITNTETNK